MSDVKKTSYEVSREWCELEGCKYQRPVKCIKFTLPYVYRTTDMHLNINRQPIVTVCFGCLKSIVGDYGGKPNKPISEEDM